jgi:hypothetical protein
MPCPRNLELGRQKPNVHGQPRVKNVSNYSRCARVAHAGWFGAASSGMGGGAGEAVAVESARANARAGGPVSERDAELLERYACLSGTKSAYCKQLEHRAWHRRNQRQRED